MFLSERVKHVGLRLQILTPASFMSPQVYVLKRPHVDEFLRRMGEMFECVLFTASLAKVREDVRVLHFNPRLIVC